MADLIDRLAGANDGGSLAPKVPVHFFLGKMVLRATNDLTSAETQTGFNPSFTAEQMQQAAAIESVLDSKTGLAAKVAYLMKLEALFFSMENKNDSTWWNPDYTIKNKARILAIMEITP